jgi:hypothetical protein
MPPALGASGVVTGGAGIVIGAPVGAGVDRLVGGGGGTGVMGLMRSCGRSSSSALC